MFIYDVNATNRAAGYELCYNDISEPKTQVCPKVAFGFMRGCYRLQVKWT